MLKDFSCSGYHGSRGMQRVLLKYKVYERNIRYMRDNASGYGLWGVVSDGLLHLKIQQK
ncbi:hypothetical protein BscR1v2_015570 [Bartonella schoenbuchensis R1]|uniref:Uncharacterized protein n=2 Tax=Bartonella schoenbuchensis TaxID=165694 RepID=A0A1S6XSH7_BARSR|nr:hypothetical protein BscR1v2_015570 [Bartonella schoenbuchensis R1]